ncbi:MAG: 1-acyl-sn-glycerol-3-phosphate acyltransferase [Fidelibacterota bacterium]|nr:MAG: 1-acyl-sn-glycerol-3-phosphate acyltransferase [Candidatus Neomarinimicrobiota bacterium]
MNRIIISILRWTFGYLTYVICGTLLIITTWMPPESLRYRMATIMSRAILWALGVRLKVVGTYPDDQSYIYMANHASFIDMFVLAAIMKGKYTGVMAEEQMKYPLWRVIINRFQAIPIRRRDREAAMAAIKVAEDRLQRGYQVGILPEGTRTLTGRLGPLKKGGFHMALNTGAPIIPIGIEGAFRFKPKTTWLLRPGPVTVRIGQPIPAERYQKMTMEEAMEVVRQQLLVLTGEQLAA